VSPSRTLSLVETAKDLCARRLEPSPHPPVRDGAAGAHPTLALRRCEAAADLGQPQQLERAVAPCGGHLLPRRSRQPIRADGPAGVEAPVAAFLRAPWWSGGAAGAEWNGGRFTHGVLKHRQTCPLAGESFDYAPFAFLETGIPASPPAYFDQKRLYAYGRSR